MPDASSTEVGPRRHCARVCGSDPTATGFSFEYYVAIVNNQGAICVPTGRLEEQSRAPPAKPTAGPEGALAAAASVRKLDLGEKTSIRIYRRCINSRMFPKCFPRFRARVYLAVF